MEEKVKEYIFKFNKEIDLCLEKMENNLKRARAGELLPDNIPKKEYLFPSAKEDPFYEYLLGNEYTKGYK